MIAPSTTLSIDLGAALAALRAREESLSHRIDDPEAPDPVLPCWFFRVDGRPHWEWDDSSPENMSKRSPRFLPDGSQHPNWTVAHYWSPNLKDQRPPEPSPDPPSAP